MKATFILLSGGSGSRIGGDLPKQFLELSGVPVIFRSADTFIKWKHGGNFICISNPDYIQKTEEALFEIQKIVKSRGDIFQILPGGNDRHESSLIGIRAAVSCSNKNDLLFLHDAARPFLDTEELNRLYEAFEINSEVEIASLVASVSETLVSGGGFNCPMENSLDRSRIFSVKTPQVLRNSVYEKLHSATSQFSGFTDLLTWGEKADIKGFLVEASPRNIKLTHKSDIELMEAILVG